mgnify:FL=1
MIEYICKECDQLEIAFEVIPKIKCSECGKYMEAVEVEG